MQPSAISGTGTTSFLGVQVIFIGDMFQLAPVAKEEEWRLLSRYYQSPYFFHSQAVIQDPPFYIEFEKIYRQTNSSFIRVLNEIRDNSLTDESFRLLEKRYNPLFTPPEEEDYIILTTHNNKADRINAEELDKLEGETYTFEAGIGGDYPKGTIHGAGPGIEGGRQGDVPEERYRNAPSLLQWKNKASSMLLMTTVSWCVVRRTSISK